MYKNTLQLNSYKSVHNWLSTLYNLLYQCLWTTIAQHMEDILKIFFLEL